MKKNNKNEKLEEALKKLEVKNFTGRAIIDYNNGKAVSLEEKFSKKNKL